MTAETRPSATASCGLRPYTCTEPSVGWARPSSMSTVVVLPAPFGPSRATTSPGRMRRLMPSPAFFVTLRRLGWFDERVVWLAPEPAEPFQQLTAAVVAHFPGVLPYEGAFD